MTQKTQSPQPEQGKRNHRAENSKRAVRLADHHIDAMLLEAVHYPQELHEPIRWLAAYVRNECNGKLPVLESQCVRLGLTSGINVTYWTKVLNGTYFKLDDKGRRMGSVDNFLATVEALKGDALAATRAGRVPFIMTTTAQRIFDYCDIKRQPDTVCKFGLIIGATGLQKTASLKHYQQLNNHGMTVMVEAPHNGKLPGFLRDLANRYSEAKSYKGSILVADIYENVNERKTIIIENIQRMYDKRGEWNQPVFNFLQKLQDDTGCTVIMTCTVDFLRDFQAGRSKGYFEQFEGRVGGERNFLVLDEYPPRADIRMIAETFGLVDVDAALPALEALVRRRGRIRLLFDVLQQGARIAAAEGVQLSIDHLDI